MSKKKSSGYLRTATLNGAGRALSVAGLIVLEIVLSRLLSPHDFAHYLIAFSIATGLGIVLTLGLNRSLAKSLKTHLPLGQVSDAANAVAKAGWTLLFVLPAIIGVLIFCGTLIVGNTTNGPPVGLKLIASLTVLASGLGTQQILAETFRALDRIEAASLYAGPSGGPLFIVVSLAIFAAVPATTGNLNAVVISQAAVVWLTLIPGIVCLQRILTSTFKVAAGESGWQKALKPSKTDFADYATLAATQFTFFACSQIDIWVAPFTLPDSSLGAFAGPRRLVMLTSAPLQLLNMTIITKVPELLSLGKSTELQQLLRRSATISFIPAAVALLVFLCFPRVLLTLFYGRAFADGAEVLRLLSVAQIVNAWTGSCGVVLMMTGHQRSVLAINTILAAGLLLLVLLLRPHTPIYLAAISGGTIAVQYLVLWGLTRATLGLWTNAGLNPTHAGSISGSGAVS